MLIEITLDAETESLLRHRAEQQEQDMGIVASELLASILQWQAQDSLEAIQGIQRGLDDFEVGQFSSLNDFVAEQQQKHRLPE